MKHLQTSHSTKTSQTYGFGWLARGMLIACLIQLFGCASINKKRADRIDPSLLPPVIDLIGYEAANIMVTRATGTHGSIHPLLAKALGVDNKSGEYIDANSYLPATTEIALNNLLIASKHYPELVRLLNPDNNIEPKASAHFSIDYSNYSENAVTFDQNKTRKSFTYEIGLSFRLIDQHGKLVYERKFVKVDRDICIFKQGNPCLEIHSKQAIQPEKTFIKTLKTAYHEALLETAYGLHAWAEVLRHLNAVVNISLHSGSQISIEQSAIPLRTQELANQNYLYISLPSFRVNIDQLFKDLETRGEKKFSNVKKEQLTNFMTTILRSHLDQNLHAYLEESHDFDQAGIFLLPDPNAIWFQDALSMLIARKINQDHDAMMMTDEGLQYDDSATFDNSCATLNRVDHSDACLSMNVKYFKSSTETPEEGEGVTEARQSAMITGVLLNPKETNKQDRYFPKDTNPLVNSVGTSNTYVATTIGNNKIEDNEHRIYLREAAERAAEQLAADMIENIILTFQQTVATHANR